MCFTFQRRQNLFLCHLCFPWRGGQLGPGFLGRSLAHPGLQNTWTWIQIPSLLLACWVTWACYLTSLCLGFLLCKTAATPFFAGFLGFMRACQPGVGHQVLSKRWSRRIAHAHPLLLQQEFQLPPPGGPSPGIKTGHFFFSCFPYP